MIQIKNMRHMFENQCLKTRVICLKTRVLCLSGEKIQFPVDNFLAEPPRSVLTAQEAEVVHTAVICFKMMIIRMKLMHNPTIKE